MPQASRHSRLPEIAGDKTSKKPFKRYPIGYFHIDIAEVRTAEGGASTRIEIGFNCFFV